MNNPYSPMLLTYSPDHVYGRDRQIRNLLRVVTAREPSGHAIHGIRTIGKTTLLKYLRDEQGARRQYADVVAVDYLPGGGKQLLFVYVNFHRFQEDDVIFYVMLDQLQEELAQQRYTVSVPPFTRAQSRQELVSSLSSVLEQLRGQDVRVVFLLDDFDIPLLQPLQDSDDHLLRVLTDKAVLIIATEAPIIELRPDLSASSPLLGVLRPEVIDMLSEQAARQLISYPLQSVGVAFDDMEEQFLIEVAGRQPFLLTVACEFYFDMRQEYPHLATMLQDPDTRANIQNQFTYRINSLPHVKSYLYRTWHALSEAERKTLYEMTRIENARGVDRFFRGASELANKSLTYLDFDHGVYRVFSHIFAEFIQQHYPEETSAQITYRGKSTLTTLSENLSPVDSAVLQYFLDNPNKVCTFDEILEAVWEDNEKSKRALEQAVYRLRKNLGPQEQIKSVFGKGYKFVTETIANSQH